MNKHQLERIAKNAAALHGREHTYTHGAGFTPHLWVLKAMEDAIEESLRDQDGLWQEGYEEGYAEGESDGYARGYTAGMRGELAAALREGD